MVKAKKKRGRPPKMADQNPNETLERVEAFLSKIAPDVVKRLASAEMRAAKAESELAFLRGSLVRLLTSDQLEAARTCGIAPEMYAIEYIDLWKERMFLECPVGIRSLTELKQDVKFRYNVMCP